MNALVITEDKEKYVFVPTKNENYVPFGHFDLIKSIIDSKQFFPLWVTGLSGNGKTEMIEQICANLGRDFVRVNFTTETDENDLIGGFRLEHGNTVFHEGPVTAALKAGAILLLDEIDVGHTNKIMCLQSVMEGKGVLIKPTGEYVTPAKGFNVIATSNTKGRGSADGRFIGTNILNGAFLDRFSGMLEQRFPEEKIENEILARYIGSIVGKSSDKAFDKTVVATNIQSIVKWANKCREGFYQGSEQTEPVSTRTLLNIIKGYAIFKDIHKSVKMACERYDDEVAEGLYSAFTKLLPEQAVASAKTAENPDNKYVRKII